MCVAFGEQVRISNKIWSGESKIDKDRVLLEVKGNNKREVSDELVAGCVKYHKKKKHRKKKHRIGDEIKYYVRYSSDDTLIAWCEFLESTILYDGSNDYVVKVIWQNGSGSLVYRAVDNKQTKKLDILLLEDWSR